MVAIGASPKRPVPLVSVAPASPQPGPISTVGASWSSGYQCIRIWAPSNDVMVRSCSTPGTGATGGGAGRSGRHSGRVYPEVLAAGAAEPLADEPDEHAPSASTTTPS